MKKLFSLIFLLFTLAACGCATVPRAAEIRRQTESVVLINATAHANRYTLSANGKGVEITKHERTWSGTGVIVDRDDTGEYVLTAGHVAHIPQVEKDDGAHTTDIYTDTEFQIQFMDGRHCEAKSVRVGTAIDLGLLKASCKLGKVAQYEMEPEYGESITTVGCPGHACESFNRSFYVGEGRWLQNYNHSVMLSVANWNGASGGPVFHNGKVVGVVYAIDEKFDGITYAIPITDVLNFLE